MKVEKLLKRLKIEFIKVNLIQASLDSILFFLSSNLILFLFSVRIVGSIRNYFVLGLATFIFFIGDVIYRVRTYHLEIYEDQNPELKEVLRTARDNLGKSNTVSQALFDELMDRARSVTSESIIPSRDIIMKIIAIGGMCFLTVGSGLVDFQLRDTTSNVVSDLNLPGQEPAEDRDSDIKNGSDILDNSASIDIETRDLEFNITGKGNSKQSEFTFDQSARNLTFQNVDSRMEKDMRLAKQYSLAIKDFD